MTHDIQHDDRWCRRGRDCTDAQDRDVVVDGGDQDTAVTVRRLMPAPAAVPGGLCPLCTSGVRHALQQLPADYRELHGLLGKGSGGGGMPVSGSRELQVPIRLGVDALAHAILDEVERWAPSVAYRCGFPFWRSGRPQDRVEHASGWLLHRLPQFLRLPVRAVARLDGRETRMRSGRNPQRRSWEDGVDGAVVLLRLHDQVGAVAGRVERSVRLSMPCPECGRRAMEQPDGPTGLRDYAHCTRCHHTMSMDSYRQQSMLLAASDGAR